MTLKGHRDEIKNLHILDDHTLISSGKGSLTSGSILFWDIRNYNIIDEKEKNLDVFSLTHHKNIIYYGGRDRNIRRMNIDSLENMSPFEPPHLDSISNLAIFKNRLISG